MSPSPLSLLFWALTVPLAACSSPGPGSATGTVDGGTVDAGTAMDAGTTDAGTPSKRTLAQNALFGDVHPQNLILDPSFSARQYGIGNWQTATADPSQSSPTFSSSYLSDAPAGIALPVARLADGRNSTSNFQLDLLAQVPGGPGPFRLRVWISTLDASASAPLSGVTVGLLTSLNQSALPLDEDPAKAQVIAGRTWHLFEGQISDDLSLGGFVLFDFAPSQNTWLLQAPEFIPIALDPAAAQKARRLPAARARPMTAREGELVRRYRQYPRISVPASHRVMGDRPPDLFRR